MPADPTAIRAQFPALAGPTVYLDNAGGSQVPRAVIDRARQAMVGGYAARGAHYDSSMRGQETNRRAHEFARVMMNAGSAGEVVLGASTSYLSRMLSECYAEALPAGAEIIVSLAGHESNIGCWLRLAARGFKVVPWGVTRTAGAVTAADLEPLLSSRTRLVVFPHVSNIFGEVIDVRAITEAARAAGARVVVDSVAWAPHRAVDAAGWGVDWCVFSAYKVYGPHLALLFGRHEAFAELTGPNHEFIPRNAVPARFELGGAAPESCGALLGTYDYLCHLAGRQAPDAAGGAFDRSVVETAFELMTELERPLQERLAGWLSSRSDVKLLGPATGEPSRVSTFSFVVPGRSSAELARAANDAGFGVRSGHFYAIRLLREIGVDSQDGVVRVSPVHYNTPDEIERLIGFLEESL